MLYTSSAPPARRRALRQGLASGRLLKFPGAFNALCALMVERGGFDGLYVSGAAVSASLGLPDVGLTTLGEVSGRSYEITRVTNLPVLVDADTGFGEPLNVARTVQVLEDTGVSGCHIEDQVNPKRCGHLDGKQVVSTDEMCLRLRAAVSARRDADFVICARTDARAVEGLDGAIERAKAYIDQGADLVFMEALADEREWEQVRAALEVPLLANMTEFGKSKLLSTATLEALGINLVIYPVTLLRLAMGAVAEGLAAIDRDGSQERLVARMQSRTQLYEVLGYGEYQVFDQRLAGSASEASIESNGHNRGGQ